MENNNYCLILAGGSGTRLWPKSRNSFPKQFLKLTDENTLLQSAFSRLEKIIPINNIYIVTNQSYLNEIIKELPKVNRKNIILEPCAKNSAPAIALGVWEILKLNNNAVIGSFASDHLVKNEKRLRNIFLFIRKTTALSLPSVRYFRS